MIITIDGPTASGKSTVAQKIAQARGLLYINSGLLFRALAYLADTTKKDPCELLKELHYDHTGDAQINYQGAPITSFLKTQAIDTAASKLARNEHVREALVTYQRNLCATHNCITEGRDAGTVVFPQAQHKFYITADTEVRAQRWQQDQARKGTHYTLQESIDHITSRDRRDQSRAIAPLTIPEGATIIDSSDKTIAEVVHHCLDLIDAQQSSS